MVDKKEEKNIKIYISLQILLLHANRVYLANKKYNSLRNKDLKHTETGYLKGMCCVF